MQSIQGTPCWYELGTSNLNAAERFYGQVLGWHMIRAGSPDFDHRLATADADKVAGMMSVADQGDAPPNWLIYFLVYDVDASARAAQTGGAKLLKAPTDMAGTRRFAVLADPQGAAFGILQPLSMECSAFHQGKPGHGHWHELMSNDPQAGFDFYHRLFGWQKSRAMDMGAEGTYQLFSSGGADIGGMMGLGGAPVPGWLPYFGVDGASAAMARIQAAGGTVLHGPMEVPGPAWIAVARDPQGAHFAVVGPVK